MPAYEKEIRESVRYALPLSWDLFDPSADYKKGDFASLHGFAQSSMDSHRENLQSTAQTSDEVHDLPGEPLHRDRPGGQESPLVGIVSFCRGTATAALPLSKAFQTARELFLCLANAQCQKKNPATNRGAERLKTWPHPAHERLLLSGQPLPHSKNSQRTKRPCPFLV